MFPHVRDNKRGLASTSSQLHKTWQLLHQLISKRSLGLAQQ
jgi:hypothetical protein